MKSAVGVFVKTPLAGCVKTRLRPAVSADVAARLYRAFLQDTLQRVGRIACHARCLVYWPAEDRAAAEALAPHGYVLHPQEGADLGERMARFFDWCFGRGIERAVVVGSDSPTLPAGVVEEALEALYDLPVVVGPCYDGGYYLIGLARPMSGLFEGVDWGTSKVLAQTVSRLREMGEKFHVLAPWYDVDTPESLRFLVDHVSALADSGSAELPRATYEVIKQLRMDKNG